MIKVFEKEPAIIKEVRRNQKVIFWVRKHIFALAGPILMVVFSAIAASAILIWITGAISSLLEPGRIVVILVGFLIPLVWATLAFIAFAEWKTYFNDVLIVTDSSVIAMIQKTVFYLETIQISIHDIQDANAIQKGLLTHLFGFGTVQLETAGPQESITISHLPYPHAVANRIMAIRHGWRNG